MNQIGFEAPAYGDKEAVRAESFAERTEGTARPSVVRVSFDECEKELDYYNDSFELNVGELVFVDGKLAGQRGRVTAVSHNFKIKQSIYKRVLSVCDTHVRGRLFAAGTHLMTYDGGVIPYEKVRSWLLSPEEDDGGYYVCFDGVGVRMDDFAALGIERAVFERGVQYYKECRVVYLSLTGDRCRALVRGTVPYEVELRYADGKVWDLTCSCPCACGCKHEAAVLLQLRELLDLISERGEERAAERGFAAVYAPLLLSMAVRNDKNAVLTLGE